LQAESLICRRVRRRRASFGSSRLEVGSETHVRHTLFSHGSKNLDRLLDRAGAVIYGRQEMRVEIDHVLDRQDLRTEIANASS